MNWNRAYSPPCITARRGGLRHQKHFAKPPKPTRPGWFSALFSIEKPPRPRGQRRLRDILLIARPPLLAVMQGGEFCFIQLIHAFIDRACCKCRRRFPSHGESQDLTRKQSA